MTAPLVADGASPPAPPLLESVLVANRGEIATRIMGTLGRMGIRSIAVYAEPDREAPHVRHADDAIRHGPASPRESYLAIDRILDAALRTGAAGIHPGYGFLSENAEFAAAVQAAGLAFIGPTPEHLEVFGQKHTARALAVEAGVPLLAGTGLLADADQAVVEAEALGLPVMIKSTGGGGGIGMLAAHSIDEVHAGFEQVSRLAAASFGAPGVFLERLVTRARHLEVQVFGDGAGAIRTFGVRDCSLQRRNQKVVEETPAPGLDDQVRAELLMSAERLAASVRYRSAGTVEFVYDADRREVSFLEVNTRLQVEHPVTEAVHGIDLVEWMVRLASGDRSMMDEVVEPRGHSIEVRVYAEDPARDYRPSAGLLTDVHFPAGVRCDTWIETGTEVTASYDPLLAKLITFAPDRAGALEAMDAALGETRVHGIETNTAFVRHALTLDRVRSGDLDTGLLATCVAPDTSVEVLRGGAMTTVQDLPGRLGYWHVGVPPSGPMDDRSFRLANQAVGNPDGAPGLEITLDGPRLHFGAATTICLAGSPLPATLDGTPVPYWEPVAVAAGAVLDLGVGTGPGLRAYLAVQGGFDVPAYLGSASTFTLGGFGGHGGRALRAGDVLHLAEPDPSIAGEPVAVDDRSPLTSTWQIGVLEGPHAAPDFFTPADIDTFYVTDWQVHHNSSRTGVRLVGPKPEWARADGGEAGLHPSNIHDTAYAVGTIDFTGDMPILLGPDGPSLGGFVCPATVIEAERWKLGQLRPGDTVRFVPLTTGAAAAARSHAPLTLVSHRDPTGGVLARTEAADGRPTVCYRRSGDAYLLVEYGPMVLDLALRMRVHALAEAVEAEQVPGIVDLTPGIRSLQLHVDPEVVSVEALAARLAIIEDALPATHDLVVPSREIHLPLSWDDPATREAIERYMAGVRDDAPWCPWNIEFIRRINGLDSVDDVHRIVFDASYLVLGLGDVYLGAPVATPLDPRHRLVTTKYNPARTWTPENAVGIGGAYLCIYGMEGPGGYQFVGRTVPVWNRFRTTPHFEPGHPWLLRFFDRIRWYPVEADELLDLRADLRAGRMDLRITDGTFALADHEQFLRDEAPSIQAFRDLQQAAFATERAAWEAAGEFDPRPEPDTTAAIERVDVPPGGTLVEAVLTASVWRLDVEVGQTIAAGDPLLALEAMKTEIVVTAPVDGVVAAVVTALGHQVEPGSPLVVLRPVGSRPEATVTDPGATIEATKPNASDETAPEKTDGSDSPAGTRADTGAALARVRVGYERIDAVDRPEIWIELLPRADVEAAARAIDARVAAGEVLPLAGLTLAVKDNIDVEGLPTTAGCPAYATVATQSAPAVAALLDAGAVLIGKTNLDQFATGLVGTRSPYGAVRNAIDPAYVSGGSSSGSGVAVALGLVDLALGTDTAGSGRVPAAFNGIIGIKPTRGTVSTRGVVPACSSFDCVTVFATSVAVGRHAMAIMGREDPEEPVRRRVAPAPAPSRHPVVGIPAAEHLELAPAALARFHAMVSQIQAIGGTVVEIDFDVFARAGALLYGGGFVAERYVAVGEFVDAHSEEVDPTVASIILAARDIPATRLAADMAELRRLRILVARTFATIDAVLVPTAPFIPTIAEVRADPVGVNSALGRYTNPVNLLDLCAIAIPAGTTDDGLPFGVSFYGPAFHDDRIADLAAVVLGERPTVTPATASPSAITAAAVRPDAVRPDAVVAAAVSPAAAPAPPVARAPEPGWQFLAVAGAHLQGQPLNHQLVERNAQLVETTTTAPDYRLYALDTTPPKPGLIRAAARASGAPSELTAPIEVEVWAVPDAGFASFVAAVPEPLAIGTVELADGTTVPGFTCMPHGLETALDITATGGWRAYLDSHPS